MIQKKFWMYGLAALVCVLLAASSGSAAVQGTTDTPTLNPQTETGLGPAPFYSFTGPWADFVKVGVTTRVFNTLDAPSQTPVFMLTVPTAVLIVKRVFICWNYLLNGVPPATDAITVKIDGGPPLPVVGGLCGSGSPDLCWGKDGAAVYKADVTAIYPGYKIVNTDVEITGATDKPLGADPMAYGEGLTILAVYSPHLAPPGNCRRVDVWCGYTSNISGGGPTSAILTYSGAYAGGPFHFFTNALDGQVAGPAPDEFFIDAIIRSGLVAGTMASPDAWHGLLGPTLSGVNNLYDHANDLDISGLVPPPGPLGLTFGTTGNDCIGHSFAAVSFPAPPELCAVVPTLSEWGLIIFSLLLLTTIVWYLRRRKLAPASISLFLLVFALSFYFSSTL